MVRTGAEETRVLTAAPETGEVSLHRIAYEPLVMRVPLGRALATRTTICKDAEAPAGNAPIDQVTVAPESVPPPEADTNVVLAGTVSVMATPVASTLPVLEKVIA